MLDRNFPNNFAPNGTKVNEGMQNDDKELRRILNLIESSGKAVSLAGTKRQCVLYGSSDTTGKPNFLTASGLSISIDGSLKPIILSFANGFDINSGAVDVLDNISTLISNAWTVPANGTYYLYVDKDISTGILNYGYTNVQDRYLRSAPISPILDQCYFNINEMKMYRYNGANWENKLRIFVGSATTNDTTATIRTYPMVSKIVPTSGIETGTIVSFAGDIAPDGYMICDGAAVSRTQYQELFATIGTKYGAGDGSTTFNIPDLRGRVIVGLNSSDTDFNTLGKTGGEKAHTSTINEIPPHNHGSHAWTDGQGTHEHKPSKIYTGSKDRKQKPGWELWSGLGYPYPRPTDGYIGSDYYNWGKDNDGSYRVQSDGYHGHNIGIEIYSNGGGAAHNNIQPYITMNKIIKY